MPSSVHDFTVKNAKGEQVNLSIYKGKVLIIVNVASECGLTNSNYTELKKLHDEFHEHGLEILAFPCNQFGGQEPGECSIIEDFVKDRFSFEPVLFEKVEVNGKNASELFKYLKEEKGGFVFDAIKWNFTKFLVDKEGKVLKRYAPTTSPKEMSKDIKKALGL